MSTPPTAASARAVRTYQTASVAQTYPTENGTLTVTRVRGYCHRTQAGQSGDCEFGDMGAQAVEWNSSAPFSHALEQGGLQCREHCLTCARCRFYSYSLRWRDCSWFQDCDLTALHQDVNGFWTAKVEDDASGHSIDISHLDATRQHGRNVTRVARNISRQKGHLGRLAQPLRQPEDSFLALLPNFTSLEPPAATWRPPPPAAPSPAPAPCFAPNVRGAHLDGEWVFEAGSEPPYEMSRSRWPSMWQRSNMHYYGLCREVLPRLGGDYVWRAHGCQLRSFGESTEDACKLLRGRRIAVAGDSTVLQFFQSLTFVLNGNITAWSMGGNRPLGQIDREDPRRIVSFACGGSVRIDFYRNDYLLYSRTDERDSAKGGSFNPSRPFTDFTSGMHHADLAVLGAGMHYFDNRASAALFTRVLVA